jgi:hypothetical protein
MDFTLALSRHPDYHIGIEAFFQVPEFRAYNELMKMSVQASQTDTREHDQFRGQ